MEFDIGNSQSNQLPADAVPVGLDGQPIHQTPAQASQIFQQVAQTLPVVQAKEAPKNVYQPKGPVEVTLPNGMTVTMAPPTFALSKPIARILKDVDFANDNLNQVERQRVRSLLYITHINGIVEPKIQDEISRCGLEQKIGDEFLDLLFAEWALAYANLDGIDLVVAKK